MVTIPGMTEHYRKAFDEHQARVLAEATVQIEADLVRREDFSKLTDTVERLALAQERTEQRMDSLVVRMDRLAEAQERTEQRMDSLVVRMDRLTAAQERTEQELGKLAASQDKLTEAMSQLAWTVRDTQKQVGGLAQTAGFALEAYALDRLPKLLARHYGFVENSALPEVFRRPDGTADEIDVVLRGEIAGRPVVFLCEVKSNVTAREVQDFLAVVARVRPVAGCSDVRMLFFGYRAGAEARDAIVAAGGYLALPHAVIVEPEGLSSAGQG
jgi:hypothetical protein